MIRIIKEIKEHKYFYISVLCILLIVLGSYFIGIFIIK
jgi:hypothetical protein